MPTLGTRARAPLLRRALSGVLSQAGVETVPIVIFNGRDVDPSLAEEVAGEPHCRTLALEAADLPAALRAGRALVAEPWFAELDDDDQLLEGALALRVDVLARNPGSGAVVTNGICRGRGGDRLRIDDVRAVAVDPLRALVDGNWLLPGSWLCRTEAIPPSVFARIPRYLECTYLAARLATLTALEFVQEPTVVYHEQTPGSESKGIAYRVGQEPALRRILQLELPADVRREFERRLAPAAWDGARALASEGRLGAALLLYARALLHPGGLGLLRATLNGRPKRPAKRP
jgi:hypothetical protein